MCPTEEEEITEVTDEEVLEALKPVSGEVKPDLEKDSTDLAGSAEALSKEEEEDEWCESRISISSVQQGKVSETSRQVSDKTRPTTSDKRQRVPSSYPEE